MTATTTGTLRVPGARLHHEVVGSGPMLLLIPGGNGDAGLYAPLAAALADRYTVVSYDRRGFSRSPLDGPVPQAAGPLDPWPRIDADVADAVHLIDALSGGGPAAVLGSSSGAIVALHLLARHPDRVTAVVAHEPPLVPLLPDAAAHLALFDGVYHLYRRSGLMAAMEEFNAAIGLRRRQRPADPPSTAAPSAPAVDEARAAMVARMRSNLEYWMEHELRQYPRAVPDLAALRAAVSRLALAGGRDSRDQLPYRPNLVLGEELDLDVTDFAGDHVGYANHPAEFAERLVEVLAAVHATAPGNRQAG